MRYEKIFINYFINFMHLIVYRMRKNVEHETETPSQDYFNAIVLEIKNGVVLAECTECESGVISVGSQISVNLDTVSSEEIPLLVVGDTIRVVYIGGIIESNPLKLQEVLSIFWVDPNGEIVTEGAEIIGMKHEPIERPDWGITFEVDEVSNSDAIQFKKYTTAIYRNEYDKDVLTKDPGNDLYKGAIWFEMLTS